MKRRSRHLLRSPDQIRQRILPQIFALQPAVPLLPQLHKKSRPCTQHVRAHRLRPSSCDRHACRRQPRSQQHRIPPGLIQHPDLHGPVHQCPDIRLIFRYQRRYRIPLLLPDIFRNRIRHLRPKTARNRIECPNLYTAHGCLQSMHPDLLSNRLLILPMRQNTARAACSQHRHNYIFYGFSHSPHHNRKY